MDGTGTKMKSFTQPKSMVDLLPGLSGILSKDSIQTLTAKKKSRNTIALSRTAEKIIKPLTIAEMRTNLMALKVQSPRRQQQPNNSVKKKNWNSSVKVDKTISHTANGQLKHNPVRKVLNFQPKLKASANIRSIINPETPKFSKPEQKAKKTHHLQVKNNIRISGVYNISETPAIRNNTSYKNRMNLANKENVSNQASTIAKHHAIPRTTLFPNKRNAPIPDTPLSNMSWKSSCDASFLQTEKAIQDIENKQKASEGDHSILENIAEASPSVSTPFKQYRNIQEFFSNSNDMENSALYNDNTIMYFDKKDCKENIKRDESVIVSLCDMLNKATVSDCDKKSSELHDLLEVEKQTEHNIEMIDHGIRALTKIKMSQFKSLEYVRKLINEKRNNIAPKNAKETMPEQSKTEEIKTLDPENRLCSSKPCSVIKSCSKSPSYKIPKKNLALRKKVFHKSMPNVSNAMYTPNKDMSNKALSIYMKMKEQMNFLNTPVVKYNKMEAHSTPAVTSHNLQMQLDKLYN